MKWTVRALAFVAAILAAGASQAQNAPAVAASGYPERSVKVIVPFAPGGPTDVMARLLAQKLTERLGKQFFVENQAGAGGNIGMANAAKAAPDGYTILVVSSSFVVNPSLYTRVPYDPYKDFAPVTIAGDSPNVLVVNPSVPAKSVKELVDLIRANPGKYNFASAGTGTTPHLSGELFKLSLKLDLVHVPFNGAGPAIQSTVAGHTPIAFTALPPTTAHVKEGRLRALAVTSRKRTSALPDVPTMEEAGLKDQEADTMQGILVPAGTPKEIVERLHREIAAIVATPEIRERFDVLGFEPVADTPGEFAARIKVEIEKWGKVIKAAHIKVQ
ncbi:MAG TPA: tripartite tricarboxylate transporter substrate binding protein [Dongiaceae bacterium]|nr:tripartite tricarboxylate transporter substrate binding protein [Dongiaceae bacterium]